MTKNKFPKNYRQILGKFGENYIKSALIHKKYEILATNYRSKFGEIDIITKKNNIIEFIEVKTRSIPLFQYPEESITFKKKQRLTTTALTFLSETRDNNPGLLRNTSWRIVVIGLILDQQRRVIKVTKTPIE